jgi:hypothetical protein
VFRQALDANRNWQNLPVQPSMATQIEDAILTRARQFRNGANK